MNIVIVNQPLGNRGDEAAHKALVRELNKRFPQAKVCVFSSNGNPKILNEIAVKNSNNFYDSSRHSYRLYKYFTKYIHFLPILYPFWQLQPIIRAWIKRLKWADVVICAPGGICMGGFMNWGHINNLAIAQYYKKPTIYFCRSIGPFSDSTRMNALFKKVSIRLLKHFDYISLRDKKSQELAASLGVKYNSTTDAAFLDDTVVEIPNEIKKLIKWKRYAVFVPNSLTWHFSYKTTSPQIINDYYIDILKHIEEKDPEIGIVMLPQTFMNPWGNDVDYFRELKKKYPSNRVLVLNDTYSSDIQQAIIRNAAFVVGARYHSVVFAINQGRPFCALSYEHKIEGLLQLLDSTSRMVNIKDIFHDKEILSSAIHQTHAVLDSIMTNDMNNCEVLRDKAKSIAKEQFDKLEKYIRQLA